MKAILEFDLPEDSVEFEEVRTAGKFRIAMWDFEAQLRLWDRGKQEHSFKDADEAIEKIRELFYDKLYENNLSLE